MTVTVTVVDHPLVAEPTRGLRPRTPSTTGSLALARPTGDAHQEPTR